MKIIIEIGNEIQRQQIENELKLIPEVCKGMPDPPPICGIWVPEDFDATINELQETDNYRSERCQIAVAKNVYVGDETALVFSKELFTDLHDNHTRAQIILHEFSHTINRQIFPKLLKESPSNHEYAKNIYILFDEYWANRKSFEITDKIYPKTSERYQNLVRSSVEGFLGDILNADEEYLKIKKEIRSFRVHGDVIHFMYSIAEYYDTIAKAVTYFFSYIHHFTHYSHLVGNLPAKPFATESALDLGEFFKAKYENNDTALFDGLKYMEKFMCQFGLHFKDVNGDAYCTVLDI